jgi:hypothetical protein
MVVPEARSSSISLVKGLTDLLTEHQLVEGGNESSRTKPLNQAADRNCEAP